MKFEDMTPQQKDYLIVRLLEIWDDCSVLDSDGIANGVTNLLKDADVDAIEVRHLAGKYKC